MTELEKLSLLKIKFLKVPYNSKMYKAFEG
jgi:hypothetical protein